MKEKIERVIMHLVYYSFKFPCRPRLDLVSLFSLGPIPCLLEFLVALYNAAVDVNCLETEFIMDDLIVESNLFAQ